MIHRVMAVVALLLIASSVSTVPAGASATVDEVFHGSFAEGAWRSSQSSFGFTLVSREQNGTTHLSVHQFSDVVLDGEGNVVSGVAIEGETTSNVSFSIDTTHYQRASVHGIIPVTRCVIVDGAETDCADAGSVTLAASWLGFGPIPHLPSTDLSRDDCLGVDRNSSVERAATFTVTLNLNGTPIPATQDGFAGFGRGISRFITVCPA